MRTFEVDERDSTWEDDSARFRVYVFYGAGNAVRTDDIVNATIEEALEAARIFAEGDRRLWSLALVYGDDSRSGRGLVWLSGNDYNSPPRPFNDSAAYWRARGAMQSRYLMARAHAGEPVVLPTGERSIRMFPEWSVDLPLWEDFTDNYPVERGSLSISTELEHGLTAWNQRWQTLADHEIDSAGTADPTEWAAWRSQGVTLLAGLRAELRWVAEVRPEFFVDG